MSTVRPFLLALLLFAPLACKPPFNPKQYPSADKLYAVALAEYRKGHYDNAAKAFEQLTLDLSARDPRLPLAYYYLAQSQTKNGEYLLAAGTYNRLIDAFPQDTLVDDAFFLSGRAYQHEWRRPQLDATYGKSAQTAYENLLATYPDSPYAARAKNELAKLDEWFAEKDYDTGYLYLKRKAYDSAIIYFKDVVANYQGTSRVPDALLRLVDSYRAIGYAEELKETCANLRRFYPTAAGLAERCRAEPSAAAPS